MKVFWLQRALDELHTERDYTAKHNPTAAREVAEYLLSAS